MRSRAALKPDTKARQRIRCHPARQHDLDQVELAALGDRTVKSGGKLPPRRHPLPDPAERMRDVGEMANHRDR